MQPVLLAFQKENIRELLRDKKVSLIEDEAEVDRQKHISVLVGSLDTQMKPFLLSAFYLKSVAMLTAVLFYTLCE